MPPKVKTDRAAIVNAAFEVAKSEGLAAVTAQSVSAVLKTSVAPIFREFQTVEDLRTATTEKNNEFHTQYIKDYSAAGSKCGQSEYLAKISLYLQKSKLYIYTTKGANNMPLLRIHYLVVCV